MTDWRSRHQIDTGAEEGILRRPRMKPGIGRRSVVTDNLCTHRNASLHSKCLASGVWPESIRPLAEARS
jgi:hypothetical protein